jgi:hypothetical protein
MITNIPPPSLNEKLLAVPGCYNERNGLFDPTLFWAAGLDIIGEVYEAANDNSIIDALCGTSHPQVYNYVIAHVSHLHADGTIENHYVIVNGQQYDPTANPPRCRFTVLDPSCHNQATYLDDTTRFPKILGLKIVYANFH